MRRTRVGRGSGLCPINWWLDVYYAVNAWRPVPGLRREGLVQLIDADAEVVGYPRCRPQPGHPFPIEDAADVLHVQPGTPGDIPERCARLQPFQAAVSPRRSEDARRNGSGWPSTVTVAVVVTIATVTVARFRHEVYRHLITKVTATCYLAICYLSRAPCRTPVSNHHCTLP